MSNLTHTWNFFQTGSLKQVELRTADDFRHLRQLDQKLWVALACPVKGLEIDEKTLAIIDTDKDGRVRAPEILTAVEWMCQSLRDPAFLLKGGDSLPLSEIREASLLASARQILSNIGQPQATSISLAQATDITAIFKATKYNGDGVITAEAAEDEGMRQLLSDILATQGSVTDRSGGAGVNTAMVEKFFAEVEAHLAWTGKAIDQPQVILPLGDETAAATAALQAVKAKIDDYFARCQIATFDDRAVPALNRPDTEYATLAAQNLQPTGAEMVHLPLARISRNSVLPLRSGLNPGWIAPMQTFYEKAVVPILGRPELLTEGDWQRLQAHLAPYQTWQSAKAGGSVEKLGLERLRQLAGGTGKAALLQVIAKDLDLADEMQKILDVEKLLRFQRDLHRLLQNFVNFAEFYHPQNYSVFQAGSLYLDGRMCELCVQVADAGKHAAMAALAKAYLVYCDCVRPGSPKMTIVAAFTNGDSDNLMVGRNGIFYDIAGRDWDATVTKIVENPISIREAFLSPYKKFLRFIEEQVAKRASEADTQATGKLSSAATKAVDTATAKEKPPVEVGPKFEVGTIAALGVGLGAIGSLMGGFVSGFIGLGWLMPLGILGIVLAISGPSMLIAALKLRQRNLAPILDANGWAINGKVKINIPFGAKLTEIAALPPNAKLNLNDPYAEKKTPWGVYLMLIVLGLLVIYTLYAKFQYGEWWWKLLME